MTTTSMPLARNARTTCEPMYPAPPVTNQATCRTFRSSSAGSMPDSASFSADRDARATASGERRVPGDRASHDESVHLACSLVGVEGLRIREEPSDVVVDHDAVAPEDLAAPRHRLTHPRCGEGLGERRMLIALLSAV